MKEQEKSEAAVKFLEETFNHFSDFDIYQQNHIILDLCKAIIQTRKDHLEKSANERDQYGKTSDEFIEQLSDLRMG